MEVLRYVAFSTDPAGGNPAGVVLDATGVGDAEMQRTAAEIGYSETAFLVPRGNGRFQVRYFSPLAEVPFCGHATIAAAAAYARRHGPGLLHFDTRSGLIEVSTAMTPDGTSKATLTSVRPQTKPIAADDLAALLAALRWAPGDLDATLPPRAAFAGAGWSGTLRGVCLLERFEGSVADLPMGFGCHWPSLVVRFVGRRRCRKARASRHGLGDRVRLVRSTASARSNRGYSSIRCPGDVQAVRR